MNTEYRTWMVISNTGETQGPFSEQQFQNKLRAGDFPFFYKIKSNEMTQWRPILDVVSEDQSFRRPSTTPPPEPTD